jgi:hypothetical protein
MRTQAWIMAAAVPALLACSLLTVVADTPQPATPAPSTAPVPSATALSPSPSATVPATTPPDTQPDEAILILQPGPGSRLVSPLHLEGEADPTFEQTLGVRVILDDGTELVGATPAHISAEAGQRGPFALDLPFTITAQRNAFLLVFADSPRDGGITHLASVGVMLAPAGPANIVPGVTHPEDIVILRPERGTAVRGGIAHVEGFGRAGFEQTLLIEVHDAADAVVGMQPVIIQAAEMGEPGPFEVDVPYLVAAEGPGRIVVRDISPAHGQDSHRASIELALAP